MIETMKALTLWQPWASLVTIEAKPFDTRGWYTNHRGPLAIHAAAKSIRSVLKECFPLGEWSYAPDDEAKRNFLQALGKAFGDCAPIEDIEGYLEELPTGCVIATADLIGCHPMVSHGGRGLSSTDPGWLELEDGIYMPTEQDLLFGDWTPGRYAWELANVKMLDIPIPAKGKQGLWNWEPPKGVLGGEVNP